MPVIEFFYSVGKNDSEVDDIALPTEIETIGFVVSEIGGEVETS